MLNGKKVIVVMPAYNAERTLKQTYDEIYKDFVDEVILVDDFSEDNTKELAGKLNITTIVHKKNRGYGANQKSCYLAALKANADIVVMLHPDYQYTPKLIPAIVSMMAFGQYDAVLASRMLGNSALKGGMPLYKFIANKFLTAFENFFTGEKLSEYHTGFRGFTREVLEKLPLADCNDDFIFDNEMIALLFCHGFTIGELTCPTKYFKEASSINFLRSCKYGLGVLCVSLKYRLAKCGLRTKIFKTGAKKLDPSAKIEYYE
ncbi:MAG: glycosyltransferase family 2 protein [Heliobacteriaceae bacterium]|jgi:glycosyltransferase involved in cell wall biosynthesis|nr:glycosyltransferase family 2 protein [Heliobacteriaceae bacterium]